MVSFDSNVNNGTYMRVEITGGNYSIPNNRTPVAWKVWLRTSSKTFAGNVQTGYVKVNGTTVWTSPSSVSALTANTWYELASGSINVDHASDGKKTIKIEAAYSSNAGGYGPRGLSIDSSLVLDPIPRISQSTIDFTTRAIGQTVRITTNRASADFTHKVYYQVPGGSWISIGAATTYVDWKLPDSLAWTTLTQQKGTATIFVETYLGDTYLGRNSNVINWTIPDEARFRPSASITSISNIDSMPAGFANTYVQDISRVRVQTSDSGIGGSTIVERTIEIDDNKYYVNRVDLPVYSVAGTKDVKITVKDSRGFTNSATSSFYITPYTKPKITAFTAERSTTSETTVIAVMKAEVSTISGNTGSYQLHSRLKGSTSWGSSIYSTTGLSLNQTRNYGGYGSDNNYEFRLTVGDKFGQYSLVYGAGTAFQLINFNKSGEGIAFGKVSEKNTMEIDMPVDLTKNLTSTGSIAANGITSYNAQVSTVGHTHSWSQITSKPSSFSPSYHTHSQYEIERSVSSSRQWTKLPDGTLIQTATMWCTVEAKSTTNFWHTWAAPFYDNYVAVSASVQSASLNVDNIWIRRSMQHNNGQGLVRLYNDRPAQQQVEVRLIAIGRWK